MMALRISILCQRFGIDPDRAAMLALRISILCQRFGIDPDRAAMLAVLVWGAGHE